MYFVMEVQDDGEHVGSFAYEFTDRQDAFAKYYSILSAAAKSSILYHGAIILNNGGVAGCDVQEHPQEVDALEE